MINKYLFKISIVVLMAALLIFLLSSCSPSVMESPAQEEILPDSAAGDYVTGKEALLRDEARVADLKGPTSMVIPPLNMVGESEVRHVILHGSMELTVKDARGTVKSVQAVVSAAKGIISGSYIYEIREGQYAAELTLRVPAEGFAEIMEQLQMLGKVGPINTGESDVTMQYLDLETRIKNLQAQEERLREILEMAKTVEEVLKVESELGRVRGEIEAMSAQFKYLQDQVSYSTINLTIREEHIATQEITPAPFANLSARMQEALVRSINLIMAAAAGLLVVLTGALPLVLILAPIVFIILRLVVRKFRRKPPAA